MANDVKGKLIATAIVIVLASAYIASMLLFPCSACQPPPATTATTEAK